MSINSIIQGYSYSPVTELFELGNYDPANSTTVFRFCKLGDVNWQGNSYNALPCETEGFEFNAGGTLPRPKIRISNVGNVVSNLIYNYNNLIGAKLTRKRTLEQFLDGQPQADPSAYFPDDIWYVERKTLETTFGDKPVIEWELSSILDLEGKTFPGRIISQSICLWRYRSSECNYAGGAVADANDNATNNLAQDVCGKRVASCKLRFGANATLPFGGFPGAHRY